MARKQKPKPKAKGGARKSKPKPRKGKPKPRKGKPKPKKAKPKPKKAKPKPRQGKPKPKKAKPEPKKVAPKPKEPAAKAAAMPVPKPRTPRQRRSKPSRKRTKVGFIGLGTMGIAMAATLVKARFPLQVWNRTPEKARDLIEEGALVAPTPALAAKGADVVIVMVADDAALDTVLFGEGGLSRGLKRGAVLVNCSTTSPGIGFRAATALRSLSVRYLEAPVMRSVQAAREGNLQILVGGSADNLAKVRTVLEALGAEIHHVGDIGRAATTKLACNLLVATLTQAFAEAFVMARKSGVPFETMMEVLHAGPLDCQVVRDAEHIVVNPGGRPNHLLRHMLKDVNLALELARQLDVPLPLTATVRQLLSAADNLGRGNDDFGAIIEMMAEWAGVTMRG